MSIVDDLKKFVETYQEGTCTKTELILLKKIEKELIKLEKLQPVEEDATQITVEDLDLLRAEYGRI
jgi:hypothetical protein